MLLSAMIYLQTFLSGELVQTFELIITFFCLFGIIFYLLFTAENKKYLTLSDKNRLRETKLPPIRGEFKDYFGNTIAGNLKVYQLHVVPEQVENFKYLIVSSSIGKKPQVAPYSGAIFAIVARSANVKFFNPCP